MVYLVGAGPGDEGLITVKGIEKLKICDVVIYDRLIGEELLDVTRPECEKIYVGKQAGKHCMKQKEINELLVKYALEQKIVVRLKGGDSFVFGRGTEEIEILEKFNICYEVIPGVTSAVAVPECAGIPVTHREVSRSFHVITGHTNTETGQPECNYKALAGVGGTIVFLMGLANIDEITENLIVEGMDKDTPCAVISGGTTYVQKVVRSSLENIAADVKSCKVKSPAVIVIGITSSYEYVCKENGSRIGIVSTQALRKRLEKGLNQAGMYGISLCDMKVKTTAALNELEEEVKSIEKYRWIVFTSQNGVDIFFNTLKKEQIDIRRLAGVQFAVLGSGTERKLKEYGINADFIPSKYDVVTLAGELSKIINEGEAVLIPRAVQGSRILTDVFKEKKIVFKEIRIYDVEGRLVEGIRDLGTIKYILFVSASGVRAFFDLIRKEGIKLPEQIKFACIGEITGQALIDEYGMEGIIASESNVEGIISAISNDYITS